ncbi:TAP42-like family [Popillia japonica]|uniref:TAP42-like family n=1 Tax=Popillia japonica TaxID=7064 RepID=A0AAW1MZ89_POPJA
MATSEESECDPKTLANMFQEGLDLYNHLDTLTEPTNSPNFQSSVKKAMRLLEDVTRLVSLVGMFSRNESIEEVATNDIQYMLLPALLGSLSLKLTSGDRNTIINVAEVYFKDFLQRCNDYGLSNYQFKDKKQDDEAKSEFDQICDAVNTRADKIQRFKKQKELKDKLQILKVNFKNEHVDEDIKREFFLTMIKLYIYESIDEINSIEMEKPILEHMAKFGKDEKPKQKRPPPPLKPIIITKDEVQKAVFGAGYPSLPTMTVQEFYEKRVQDGIFPDPNKPQPQTSLTLQEASLAGISLTDEEEKENEQQEKLIEDDDPAHIEKIRAMDEYKDDHRRGWGNRMNRS